MKSLPRILYVLHDNINNVGGTEYHTSILFSRLGNYYDTWVVYPYDNSLRISNDGEKYISLPAEPVKNPFIPPYSNTLINQSFEEILTNIHPDIIHIQHFIRWPLNIIDLASASKIPTILSIHDYYSITPEYIMYMDRDPCEPLTPENSIKRYGEDISGFLKKRREFLAASMQRVSRLVVPSKSLRHTMSSVFPGEYTVIPHGIPPFTVCPKKSNGEMMTFGYAGKLIPSKGWKQLLDAFLALRKIYSNTELHFFGEMQSEYELQQPDDREHTRSLENSEGVVCHGEYDTNSLDRLFSLIDVLVIPSLTAETYSLVLSEAWMAGLPVAVSDIGALGDRVKDGVNGKKFQAGNIGSIKDTMAWFVEHDSWKTWVIDRPRTTEEMISDYDDLYKGLL